MKRIIALLLTLTIITAIFAGCNSNPTTTDPKMNNTTSETTDGTTASSDKKDITITFGSHQSGLPTSGIVQEIAKEYAEKTGVKIDFQISPDAQWKDIIKTKILANEAPDIFCVDSGTSLEVEYRVSENCIDLSNENWVSRMDETVLPMVSVNDKTYGITFPGYKVYWYYYNKAIFSDLGIEAPKTYQEFKDACEKIKSSGVTPIYEAIQDGWHQQLPIFELGGLYSTNHENLYEDINANKKTVHDIPEMKTVISQMLEFQELGYYGDDLMSNSVSNGAKAFADGKVAMVLDGFGWEQQTNQDFPETVGNIGFFVMPWADNQVLGVNPASNAYFISKDSKYIDEAKAFFDYLAQPEVLKQRLDGDPTALALCWPEIDAKYPQSYKDYIDSLEKGLVMQVGVPYTGSQWMDVGKDVAAMYVGGISPEDILNNIQDRIDKQAKLAKDPNWEE